VVNEVKAVKNNFLFHFFYPNEQRTRRYNQCHYPGQEYEQGRVQNHVIPPYLLVGTDDITSVIILDRSMNREEFKTMYPPISPCGKNSYSG